MRACCQMVRPCDLVIITSLRSLVNSSVNMTMPAFAAAAPLLPSSRRPPLSINISCFRRLAANPPLDAAAVE